MIYGKIGRSRRTDVGIKAKTPESFGEKHSGHQMGKDFQGAY